MNQDIEQLRLLAIFHYVVAGLAALFSLFPLQTLYLRARDGLRRMPLYSVRNNSRSLYDYCAFARTGESVVCDGAAAVLKDDARTPPRLREIKEATGDFARSAVECDASSHRF